MTRKPSLYAGIAALVLCGPATAASLRPPCGACVEAPVRAADWDEDHADTLALVLTPAEILADADRATRLVRSARTVVIEPPEGTFEQTSFAVRRALAAVRGANPTVRLGLVGSPAVVGALLDAGVAAYVDFVAATERTSRLSAWKVAHPGLEAWGTVPLVSFEQLADESASLAGDGALIWPPITPTPELVEDLARFASVFPSGLVPSAGSAPACDPAERCRVSEFERPETHERLVVIRRNGEGPGRAAIVLRAPRAEMFAIVSHVGASPAVRDSLLALAPAVADTSGAIHLWLPVTGVSHLIARIAPSSAPIAEEVSVVGARELTIEEIIARHQAQASRQGALIKTLVTHARTTVTFEVPAFAAPVTVQARTELLEQAGTLEVAQRDITVNGVAFSESAFPRLPIVEPERVVAPPLAITLTRAYRYRLAGRETVNGRDAYAVAFDPTDPGASLFQGRAWIDAATFGLLRVDAVQTNLRGPITASEQIDEFAPERAGDGIVWLLARSEIRQIYHGAGVTTPIQRVMVVDGHEINVPDLDARVRAADTDGAVRLHDTGQGLRYVDRGRAGRIVTLGGGVLIDPNISQPLPFAGINYSDFDVAGSGAALNAFFGGAYGQFAFSLPSIAGSRWQFVASGFAMLARYNDRAFRVGREHYDENLSQRPAHASAGIIRPLDPRTSAKVEYVFDYVALDRSDSTAASFVLPSDQVVHAVRLSVDRQQWGWRLTGWWNPARRAGWRAWGYPGMGDYREGDRTFQRLGFNASRPFILAPRLLARVEAAWMAGSDLDRFSRYTFDAFENRLHGYPSAGVRYDRGGILRTAMVAQPAGRVRLDGFADLAVVRDRGFGRQYRVYPGLGIAADAPGPAGLLLGVEWGYGFEGLNANGGRGTQVMRFTAYKLF